MNEQRYFDVLKRIAKDYMSVEELRRKAEKTWGLPYEECLEMVLENIQAEAAAIIKGKKRPK